jgi:hypothetical protein
MPDGVEYLHAVLIAIDDDGLPYQVLDTAGTLREWANWPPDLSHSDAWSLVSLDVAAPAWQSCDAGAAEHVIPAWRFRGITSSGVTGAQTLLSYWNDGHGLPPLWIGLIGREQRLSFLLSPQEGRSPHLWYGPSIGTAESFDLQVALHPGLGPGGLLWRSGETDPWSSLVGTSPWGVERLPDLAHYSFGRDHGGLGSRPLLGSDLVVTATTAVERQKMTWSRSAPSDVPVIRL